MEMNLTDVIIRLAALAGKPVRIKVVPHDEIEIHLNDRDEEVKHSIILSGKLSYRGDGVWNVCTKSYDAPYYASDIAFFEAYDIEAIKETNPPMIYVSWD